MNNKVALYKDHLLNKLDTFREFEISFSDILKALTSDKRDESLKQRLYRLKAMAKIKNIEETDDYYIISYNEIKNSLYYPKSEDIYSVFLNAMEAFYPKNGHYYQISPTRVEKDDIVADCGAAEGLFSLAVCEKCKKVYAIEPLPKFLDSMHTTFRNLPSVEIVPVALSSGAGTAKLSAAGAASSLDSAAASQSQAASKAASDDMITVQLDTIDNLFYKRNLPITYLKADVEGFEMEMLQGAIETIRANLPKIAITTYHKPDHSSEISRFIKAICPDYKIHIKGSSYLKSANRYLPMMVHAWIEK